MTEIARERERERERERDSWIIYQKGKKVKTK
jgi:hypothetical protein